LAPNAVRTAVTTVSAVARSVPFPTTTTINYRSHPMWNHHHPLMQQLVRSHQQSLMAAGERSRVRRTVRDTRRQPVHRPTKAR